MKHGIVGRFTSGYFRYQGWPTVARAEDGTLYAACSGHRLDHVCPFGKNLMYVSHDDGKTWSEGLLFEERDKCSYPDAVETEDGRIYIVYDRERYEAREILLASIREKDILAQNLVSDGSFIKKVINHGAK